MTTRHEPEDPGLAGRPTPADETIGVSGPVLAATTRKSASTTAAKKTTAKKTAAKKAAEAEPSEADASAGTAPAKPTSTTKSPAKKTAAKKSPAKKSTADETGDAPAATSAPAKSPATKSAATKATGSKAASSSDDGSAAVAASELSVREDEDPWTDEQLAEIREELDAEIRRHESQARTVSADLEDLLVSGEGSSGDAADIGTSNFERDQEMTLAAYAREAITQTRLALAKMDDGSYGRCDSCGQPIGKGRLQAYPRATLCMTCKQREERR